MPYIIYADFEILIEKLRKYEINPEKSSATKIDVPCRYSMSTIWAFDNNENKHAYIVEKIVKVLKVSKRTYYKCN